MNAAISEAIPALSVELREPGRGRGRGRLAMNFVEPLRRFVAETDVDVLMVAWPVVARGSVGWNQAADGLRARRRGGGDEGAV